MVLIIDDGDGKGGEGEESRPSFLCGPFVVSVFLWCGDEI